MAWIVGILLLNLAFLRPNFLRHAQAIEREIASEWLRMGNGFVRVFKSRNLACTSLLAEKVGERGSLEGVDGALLTEGLSGSFLMKHGIRLVVLCDAARRVVSAWTVGRDGRLKADELFAPGTDLSDSGLFEFGGNEDKAAGIAETPIGLGIAARCAVRVDGLDEPIGHLLTIRQLDRLFWTQISAMVGTSVSLKPLSALSGHRAALRIGSAVWRADDNDLIGAQPLLLATGERAGYLVVKGKAEPSYQQTCMFARTLTATISWAACFALLMIVMIHVVVSSPTAKLLKRVQRLRAGDTEENLSAGLRGEALALAEQFEEVLSRVEKVSETDSLTGVRNRRCFQHVFRREFHRARRYGRSLSLVMMDIDFLKAANDVLGHQVGDEILKIFAQVIGDNIREADIAARLGGDEFAALMPETTGEAASAVAERIRACLASQSIGRGEVMMSPTASIGVADMNCPGADSPDALFNLADRAMYAAKRAGRNRIIRAEKLEEVTSLEQANDRTKVDDLCKQLAGLDAKFKRLFVEAIGGLISALEARDVHTANHSAKVRRYSLAIGRQMKLPERALEHLGRAAMLHDIGKIGLPDSVLLKEGALTEEEWKLVKRHPVISVRIMEGMEFLDQEIPSVRYHHERYDGSGYPEGLAGSAIPLGARILAVADAFDAMTSSRTYRSGMSVEKAMGELSRGSGTQFDPAVVDAFKKVVEANELDHEVADAAGSPALA